MEPPRRAVAVERALAALAVSAALGASWAESGSDLASRIRDGRTWGAWLEAREPAPAAAPTFHLAVYDPTRRRLSVLHIPGSPRAAEDRALRLLAGLSAGPMPAPSTRLLVAVPRLTEQDEPSAEAARALKARVRSPRAWLALISDALRGLRTDDRDALDRLLFAVELRRMPVEHLRPSALPDDAAAADLLGNILSGEERPRDGKATTAEVLNGTQETGLASRASKMLRLKGVDVMAIGGTRARARTLVYDRTGDFRRAAEVRAALPCPTARIATRLDPSRAVDVSIEIGEDCADASGQDGADGF